MEEKNQKKHRPHTEHGKDNHSRSDNPHPQKSMENSDGNHHNTQNKNKHKR